MKFKHLLATLLGVAVINVAVAGPYCAPPSASDKCPVECCPDSPGYVGVSYMSDYIFRGVRYSRDTVGAHASYTIDNCFIPVTLGINHYSSLSSTDFTRTGIGGDHTNLFAEVGLPSICGFDLGLRYDHYLYPNVRTPDNLGVDGARTGDSHGALGLTISREVLCGVTLAYTAQYDFNAPSAHSSPIGLWNSNNDDGAWIHTIDLSKSFCINDCVSLDLSAGVLYTDNVYGPSTINPSNNVLRNGPTRSAGWNNYYIEAALPIAVGNCATLTPYIGYNGTPDTWQADGVQSNTVPNTSNDNDIFHGGVRLGVKF